MPADPEMHTLDVVPPSRVSEAERVTLVSGLIVLVALWSVAFRLSAKGTIEEGALLPFQIAFQDLPSAEQRVFRELQEGFGEARRTRIAENSWPAPERLAEDGVPPFAPDPQDRAGYRWSLSKQGLTMNYLGIPTAPDSPDVLLFIQEPEPNGGETGVSDEEHQVLTNGRLMHVMYWKRKTSGQAGLTLSPQTEGWSQIRFAAAKELQP
jgi:hypothetical protein